jgi:tripeptidyl-peptidase I
VCSAPTHNITSGGGFSTYYPQPSFQTKAVESYFVTAKESNQNPVKGYNPEGRGYPDISLAGANYLIVVGGMLYYVSGTSASAPAVAGFFSNINAARKAIGKGSIGWVNPVLYANSTSFTNDITEGDNRCAATNHCCPQGFYATKGWDPTTGLGSLDYTKLYGILVNLGVVNGYITSAPSRNPLSKYIKNRTLRNIILFSTWF